MRVPEGRYSNLVLRKRSTACEFWRRCHWAGLVFGKMNGRQRLTGVLWMASMVLVRSLKLMVGAGFAVVGNGVKAGFWRAVGLAGSVYIGSGSPRQ